MKALVDFLRSYKTNNTAKANWISLKGGKFSIPPNKELDFYKITSEATPHFNEQQSLFTSLVFRPPRISKQPFMVDLDFQTQKIIQLPLELIIEFGKRVAKKLQAELNQAITFIVVTKPKGYFKVLNKINVFKSGGHLYFNNVRVDKPTAIRLRSFCVGLIGEIFAGIDYTNSDEDVVDNRIPFRQNGLMMIGDYKPFGFCGGRYSIRYTASLINGNFTEDFLTEERFLDEYRRYLPLIYSFVFEKPEWEPKVLKKKVTPVLEEKVQEEEKVKKMVLAKTKKKDTFNLNLFLEVTAGWTPREDEYKQICMFLENQGMDPTWCNEQCNRAWGYSTQETSGIMKRYNGDMVTRASIIRLLFLYGKKTWEETEMFPGKCYQFHNESRMFDDHSIIWNIDEVIRFCTDVYGVTWGDGETEFIYREKVFRRMGHSHYTVINTVISPNIPFSNPKNDKLIRVEPTLETIKKLLLKFSKKNSPTVKQADSIETVQEKHNLRDKILRAKALQKTLKQLDSDTIAYKKIKLFLADDFPEPQEKSLSYIFTKAKQRGAKFRLYHSYVVEPFLWENTACKDKCNIFPGFNMKRFAKEGNVRNTRFWKFLWIAWANEDEYRMEWILVYFASKLQFPARKIKKFLIAFCRNTGCGKTSIRAFLECIFDVEKILFCDSIEELKKEENSEFLNKMFCITDDIEKCKRSLADSLKSLITSETFKYKKLYKDKVTLPSYLDLIATSNSRNPVFIGDDNRRTELITINPSLKGDKEFWDGFYRDTKDPKIAGMWFHFLAHKELTLDVYSENCRFDKALLQKHKCFSMKLVHRFVVEFFQDPECFERACPNSRFSFKWFSKIRFLVEDNIKTVFIERMRIFQYFQSWRKTTGQRLDCKLRTFVDDLKEIGITIRRRMVEKQKLSGFDFRSEYISRAIRSFYKLDSLQLVWCWWKECEFEKYAKKEWMFNPSPEN